MAMKTEITLINKRYICFKNCKFCFVYFLEQYTMIQSGYLYYVLHLFQRAILYEEKNNRQIKLGNARTTTGTVWNVTQYFKILIR